MVLAYHPDLDVALDMSDDQLAHLSRSGWVARAEWVKDHPVTPSAEPAAGAGEETLAPRRVAKGAVTNQEKT
jgi:hypothetical protein